jgi:hypothetical protein
MALQTSTLFDIVPDTGKQLRVGNEFVKARYEMTVMQSRIFACLLDQVREDDLESKDYVLHVSDFTDRDVSKHYHADVRRALDGLQMSLISFPHPERPQAEVRVQLAGRAVYERGLVIIRLDGLLRRLMLDLRKGWTGFQLDHIFRIQSQYGWRFYLLFSRWADVGQWRISIEELRGLLNLTDRYEYTARGPKKLPDLYPRFADLRVWVLDAAMRDLKENVGAVNPSYVVLDQHNKPMEGRGGRGRKATYLLFTWGVNGKGSLPKGTVPKPQLALEKPKLGIMDKATRALLGTFYGFNRGQIQTLRSYPDQEELAKVAREMMDMYDRPDLKPSARKYLLNVLVKRGKEKGWDAAWAMS